MIPRLPKRQVKVTRFSVVGNGGEEHGRGPWSFRPWLPGFCSRAVSDIVHRTPRIMRSSRVFPTRDGGCDVRRRGTQVEQLPTSTL
jgi:hypothetical protein